MNKLSTNKLIKEYESHGIPNIPKTSYEALKKSADQHAEKTALHYFLDGNESNKSFKWTYKEFIENVNATSNMFNTHGLGKTDTVSYILPNLPATCYTFFGGEARGIVNPINPLLEIKQMVDILNAAKTKILVTLAPFPNTPLWQKIEQVISKVPTLETVFTVSLGHHLKLPSVAPVSPVESVSVLDFYSELSKYNKEKLDFKYNDQPNDIASYFHTGGTTGSPKLAQRTHLNEMSNAYIIHQFLQVETKKVFLCGLPWFHVNGVVVTGMLPLFNGHELVLATPAGYRGNGVITNFWKIIEEFNVTFFSTVPTILKTLLTIPIQESNICSLEYALCGAAPLSTALYEEFQNRTNVEIIEGYGFTEGTCVNTVNPLHGQKKVGSIGLSLPFHYLKVVIINENGDFERNAETDEIGIFVAKGLNVIPGYKEEKHNVNAFIFDGKDKWYNTGDVGRKDKDGYFWITGRKKELIIRGGHNIDPKSIEEPLSKHPSVAGVAAVSRPDAYSGEIPVAYIELKGEQNVSVEELMQYAKEHISERAAIPKKIYIIEQLPLTAVGKVFKPKLINEQIQEVFSEFALKTKGVEQVEVKVVNDDKTGKLTIIKLQVSNSKEYDTVKKEVENALGVFTIKFEIR